MRVAVIGSGVSGIAAARVLGRFGHEVIVYEALDRIGGVWAITYPEVRLQNVADDYHISDFPWPFEPDRHPTTDQILRYLHATIDHFGIDVRVSHEVTAMRERADGWDLDLTSPAGETTEAFDYVVVAIGHYSGDKPVLDVLGQESFRGTILTERDVRDLAMLGNTRVAVVGFGKTAVDMATFAAQRGSVVHHIFRAARWMIPRKMFGTPIADMASRVSSALIPVWTHGPREAKLHKHWHWLVRYYWWLSEKLFRGTTGLHQFHLNGAARRRLKVVEPDDPLLYHMRAAIAQAPDAYYGLVRDGAIEPHRAGVEAFDETGLKLSDGSHVEADVAVVAIGQKPLSFPFLPDVYRRLMTGVAGGTQLYRHIIHPQIPRVAFAGFNHASLHIAAVEISMIWLCAMVAGDIVLPPVELMLASMGRVQRWKTDNSLFEATQAYGIGGRFHQYAEVLLAELGVRGLRKRNWVGEAFTPYVASDFATVFEEYQAARAKRSGPMASLPLDA